MKYISLITITIIVIRTTVEIDNINNFDFALSIASAVILGLTLFIDKK